ncbi:hypothetical protein RFI_28604 [Reticulomyxa filosa]|uniref:JmjC domain-containing protein n=1 Tax=Reticulomyxa filosa TaxID=46433 RepID=X6M4C8_RETFI|nr:hypothetical protein RFI_28604 [Reticulomyxa filosa]|eukprot:ETO08784.1 hypothetical protein RFI_28604 [Reticulomyxa filosa]
MELPNFVTELTSPLPPQEFFKNFISARKPAHIKFISNSLEKAFENWKSNKYLKQKCENEIVKVETRNSDKEKFGTSNKVLLPFCDFLNLLETGEDLYYMTVQDIETDEKGPLELYSHPLASLKEDFPLILSDICPSLITHQINMWMGHSGSEKKKEEKKHEESKKTGTQSKLHHDFHDNIYLVIRGEKTFTLFPPHCVHQLYVNGEISQVYDNGLICYKNDWGVQVREDGADLLLRKKMMGSTMIKKKKKKEEEEIDDDEEDVDFDDDEAFSSFDEDNEETNIDDYMDKMLDKVKEKEMQNGPPSKKRKLNNGSCSSLEKNAFDLETEDNPMSFSQIDLRESETEIIKKFPKYNQIKHEKIVVTIKEGEMLYLPSGWFHEVTSLSNPSLNSHLALSYWMYPPMKTGTFEKPYCDNYWKDRFEGIQANHL